MYRDVFATRNKSNLFAALLRTRVFLYEGMCIGNTRTRIILDHIIRYVIVIITDYANSFHFRWNVGWAKRNRKIYIQQDIVQALWWTTYACDTRWRSPGNGTAPDNIIREKFLWTVSLWWWNIIDLMDVSISDCACLKLGLTGQSAYKEE